MSGCCDVCWGSHACDLERGHEGEHLCSCTFFENGELVPHMNDCPPELEDEWGGNVGRAPYYGSTTNFYGEDVTDEDWRRWGPDGEMRPDSTMVETTTKETAR